MEVANAENKDLKLQMVDLEGKVRIMRKESENAASSVKLATTEKNDAINQLNRLLDVYYDAKEFLRPIRKVEVRYG